jgi:hypothetical protein
MGTPLGALHAVEKNDINKVASPNSTLLQLCYAIIYDGDSGRLELDVVKWF